MSKQFKKILALALTFVMLSSMFPLDALAALITTDYSGGISIKSIIPTEPPVTTRTYNFVVDDIPVDTQIIKNNEYLTEPQAPEKANHRFVGWFIGEDKVLFGAANPISFSEGGTFTATPRFEPIYYVFFMSSANPTAFVYKTKEGESGTQITTDDVVLPIDSTQVVTGWYKDRQLTDGPVGANFTIGTSNQKLWPKIETGNFIYFVSGEQATYVPPKFVAPGNPTQAPTATMTRPGYTFSHWSETEGGTAYTFGQPITSDVTLYAVWTPKTVNYTVIFWKQSIYDSKNATDSQKKYDYAGESNVRQALAGSTVSPTAADKAKDYTGFHYNEVNSVSATVNGDGSTTLNVYYDRNLLTMEFQQSNWQYGQYTTIATYTGLYGQSLAHNGYSFITGRNWQEYYYNTYRTKVTFLDAFIYDDLNAESRVYPKDYLILRTWSPETGSRYIRHYKQNLDGTYPDQANNTNTTSYLSFYMTNKYVGFTVAYWSTNNSTWTATYPTQTVYYGNNHLYIRHTRNTYDLSFRSGGTVVRTEDVLFEQPLAAFADYVPPRPSAIPDTYTFAGWYKDEAHTQLIDLGTEKMEPNSLMVYAKWSPPVVHATVYQSKEGGASTTHTLPYNEPLDQSILPTIQDANGNVIRPGNDIIVTVPTNHKWVSWSTKSGDTYTTFNFATKLTQDIELYPYYVNIATYSVTYSPGAGTGSVSDSEAYFYGSYADVRPGSITPPAGQVFLGWTLNGDTSGKIYVANDKIYIDGNKVLTAAFGPKLSTTLTYTANGGVGDPVVYNLQNNQQHTIIENPSYIKEGYHFIGWNTYANGSGQTFKPGQDVLVDGADNTLYALWEALIPITAAKAWDFPALGIARPTVWFTLYRINVDNTETAIGTKQVPDSATGGIVTWEGQLNTDGNGYTYQYYVKETNADGADYTPPSFSKVENGLTVTNRYEYIDFSATKVWAGDHLPTVKPEIQLQLQASADGGATFAEVPGKSINLTDGNTAYTWYNLPKQNAQGKNLIYRAIEPVVPASYLATYAHTATSSTITNTYQSTPYAVTKNWSYASSMTNPPDVWPAIQLQLYQDGIAYGDYIHVPEQPRGTDPQDNTFSYAWEGLPKLRADGTDHVYTVRELVVPKQYVMTAVDTATETTIGNMAQSDSLTGTKHWVGELPPAGASVTLQLYQTVKDQPPTYYREPWGAQVVVTAADNWQHTWTGMPATGTVNSQSVEFEYEIHEVSPPTGYYHDAISSASLYVTNVSETVSFTANKIWSGGAYNRPQGITLYLERSTDNVQWEKVTGSDYVMTAADNNQHTWTELDHYHAWHDTDVSQRVKYIYRVREVKPPNYDIDYEGNNTVINTYKAPTRTVAITKQWSGGPAADHVLPAIHLWRRLMDDTTVDVTADYTPSISPDPANGKFTITYENLPATDGDGNPFLYGFTEDEVTGYTTEFSDPYLLGGVVYALPGSTITNTYDVPMTASLTAKKEWVNGPDADHVRVRLTPWRTINNVETTPPDEIVMQPVTWFLATVTPPDGTSDTFVGYWPGLAATDNDGNPYTYFFTEDIEHNQEKLENYDRSYTDYITVNGVQYAKNDSWVKNTYDPPTDGTATATKQWVNGNTDDHIAVLMTLYRSLDGGATMEEVPNAPDPVVTDNGSAITYAWSNLQRTDINGVEYQFFFTEDATMLPMGYALSYSVSTTAGGVEYAPSGATAINTYTPPKAPVTATKIWENGLALDHVPVTLTLHRMIQGGALAPVDAAYNVILDSGSAPNETRYLYTWPNVDTTDIDGNPYIYYIKEDEIDGYARIYETEHATEPDYGLAGGSVTNSYVPRTGTLVGEKNWAFAHGDAALPEVHMELYRSLDPFGAEKELVPNTGRIQVGSPTLNPDDPNLHTAYFQWENVQLTHISGQLYYFFVKEVDGAGNDYQPEHFEKFEVVTAVYNVYVAPGSFTPTVTKVLNGRPLKDGEFSFKLVKIVDDGAGGTTEEEIETVTNNADGTIPFTAIEYGAQDIGKTYQYIIREVEPTDTETGMTYDQTAETITVEITDNGVHDGVLIVTPTYNGDKKFINSYAATGTLLAQEWTSKALTGRTLQADEFSFELRLKDSPDVLQTKKNAADGSVTFDAISYTQADIGKTYTYTASEVVPTPGESGMAYDTRTLEYTVAVTDAGDGKLNVILTKPAESENVFKNIFTPDPKMELGKAGTYTDHNGDTKVNAGDRITYVFTVTNTGNVTLTNITVTDNNTSVVVDAHTIASLAPGATATATGYYELTQTDIDAGTFTNTATATGTDPSGAEVTGSGSDTKTFAKTATASLTKAGTYSDYNGDGKVNAGDRITYVFTVTNTGNVTLTNITVTDNNTSVVVDAHTIASLAPGATATATGYYELTQTDIDAGTFTNTATATGTDPSGAEVTGSGSDTKTFAKTATASLTKAGTYSDYNGDGKVNAGDRITYVFTVTNTGNVTLTNITVTDNNTSVVVDAHTIASLAPGATATATGYYELTQTDIDAGTFTNTATASGTDPDGESVTGSGSDTQVFTQSPKLTLAKNATPNTITNAGDIITYTVTLTNEGNVTVSKATITDTKEGLTDVSYKHVAVDDTETAATNGATTLLPGEKLVMTAKYAATQADIDAGKVTNSATGSGEAPNPDDPENPTPVVPENPGTVDVPATQSPKLTLAKNATPNTITNAGDIITYTVTLTNEGNVTVSKATITDTKEGLTDVSYKHVAADDTETAATNGATTLLPGEKLVMTAKYAVTQADIDAGKVTNSATGSGEAPNPDDPQNPTPVVPDEPGTVDVPATQSPKLTLTKSATPNTITNAGDVITYTVTLTNEGNVTVSKATITDTKEGLTDVSYKHVAADDTETAATNGATTLLPGEKLVMTAKYAATQADIDAGKVTNSATGSGEAPNPDDPENPTPVVPENPGTVDVPVEQTSKLTLTKNATPDTITKAGDVITYTVTLTNEGNVTVSKATITDTKEGLTDISYKHVAADDTETAATNGATTLLPGEKLVMTAKYTVTQADIDAGKVSNSATGSGEAPNPDDPQNPTPVVPENPGTVDVPATQSPKLTLTKSATPDTITKAGDIITYTVTLTNEGNVTVSKATITDTKEGLTDVSYKHVAADDTETAATNGATTLLPGEKLVMTAKYAVTQADVDAGKVTNSATGNGEAPNPEDPENPTPVVPENPGTVDVPVEQTSKLTLTKSATPDTITKAGDVITYTVTLTNEGNVTVSKATITDTKEGLTDISYKHVAADDTETAATNGATTLLPGEKLVMTAKYAATQADIDAGKVTNSATGSGEAPNPDDPENPTPVVPENPGTVDVPATQSPKLTLAKNATPNTITKAGDVITYTVTLTNEGNVTVSKATITDEKTGLVNISYVHVAVGGAETPATNGAATLLPGETLKMTALYAVTQADIDAGKVTNSATGSGEAPNPDDPQNPTPVVPDEPGTVDVPATQSPKLTLAKNATPDTITKAGDVITYTVTLTNEGNVTVSKATITDTKEGLTDISYKHVAADDTETAATNGATTLLPGEKLVMTAKYAATQADIDAGKVTNSATGSGEAPNPEDPQNPTPVVPENPGTVDVPATQSPKLTIAKSATPDTITKAGDIITYTVTLTNEGNVTVSKATITDTKEGLTDISYKHVAADDTETAATNGATTLLPGEKLVMTAKYAATQADVDAGKVTNSATGSGEAPNPDDPQNPTPVVPENPGTVDVPADQQPGMTVSKSLVSINGDESATKYEAEGDEIAYKVVVTNTGNVTLTEVNVEDSIVTLTTAMLTESKATDGKLEVGETWTYEYTYTIKQADLDAGSVTNAVKATSEEISGDDPDNSPPSDEETVDADQRPGMKVRKKADKVSFAAVGDVIRFTIVVTNTGNVTLTEVVVKDNLVKLKDSMRNESKNADGKLEVGETWTYTYTYTVKQSDLDAGKVLNTVSIKAKELPKPVKDEVTVPAEDDIADPASGITTINVGDCYE